MQTTFLMRVYTNDQIIMFVDYDPVFNGGNNGSVWNVEDWVNGQFVSNIAVGFVAGGTNNVLGTWSNPGVHRLIWKYQDPVTGALITKAFVDIAVIPKVEKVWVEAPEICPAAFLAAQQPYYYNVKTYPAMNNMMYNAPTANMGANPNGGCYSTEMMSLTLTDGLGFSVGTGTLNGSTWPPATLPDNVTHYIPYANLASVMSSPNPQYNLNMTYDDGIQQITVPAPIIINDGSTSQSNPSANIPAAGYHFYDYDVYGTEVWTPTNNPLTQLYGTGGTYNTIRIQHQLNIAPGARLRVQDMTVEFGPMATTVLHTAPGKDLYGGYLKMQNAIFTAYHPCGNNDSVWEGITVMGDNSQNQEVQNSITGQRWQGTLLMENSTVSYAHEAVMACDVNDVSNKSGGVVIATNSLFYNNCRSVALNNYKWQYGTGSAAIIYPYRANFSNCDFKVDRALKYNFRGFITGWQVRGVFVQGSRFKNLSGINTPYNYGLYGTDFGVVVDKLGATPSEFYNMKQAVRIDNISGTSTISIKSSKFYNNDTSVIMTDVTAPLIKGNEVNISKGTAFVQKLGMLFQGGKNYTVNDNLLQSTGAYRNTGVLVANGGSADNVIKRNTYSNLTTGNLSNFINTNGQQTNPKGLQFLCNSHTANTYDEAARGNNPSNNGMRASQGSATIPAADVFNGGGTHQYEIYNPPTEVGGVTYFANPNIPLPTHLLGALAQNGGGTNDCKDPVLTGPSGNGYTQYVAQKINTYMSDETALQRRDSLYYWVHQVQDAYGALLNVDLLLEDGDITNANSMYNSIAGTYNLEGVEAAEFTNYGRSLMDIRIAQIQDKKNLQQLDGAQVATLEGIAANAQLWAKYRAQSWLSLYDGRSFANTLLFPEDAAGSGRMTGTAEQQPAANLFPNPVTDQLQVSYSNSSEAGSILQITDLTGRLLISRQLEGKGGLETIDVRQLVPGMYLYRILDGKTIMTQGKIVKE